MKRDLTFFWYRKSMSLPTLILLPISWLFGVGAAIRRWSYRYGIIKKYKFSVPVMVVGNITIGGTGKTPFVIWLANFLQAQGFYPGIVSRGVGGKRHILPYTVQLNDLPEKVGDEALVIVNNTNCPLVISLDRVAAVRELLKKTNCNIVISDDGLQHYRLERDVEVIMIDGERRFGNHFLLPAGPLRESLSRLNSADFIVVNGGNKQDKFTMFLESIELISIKNAQHRLSLADFPLGKVHAVAGIGNPKRFFEMLKIAGFDIIPHVFPDHYHYQARDLDFKDGLPILMTQKDAVKCKSFANQHCWYLSIDIIISAKLEEEILNKLKTLGVNNNENKKDFTKHACSVVDSIQRDTIC